MLLVVVVNVVAVCAKTRVFVVFTWGKDIWSPGFHDDILQNITQSMLQDVFQGFFKAPYAEGLLLVMCAIRSKGWPTP